MDATDQITTEATNWYRPQTKLRQGNVFTPVCDSVHRVGGGTMSRGVSVRGCLCPEGLCPAGSLSWEVSLSRGVSVLGVSFQRESLSWGCLCPGRPLSRRPPSPLPPYGYVRAIRILLECILV